MRNDTGDGPVGELAVIFYPAPTASPAAARDAVLLLERVRL